MYTKQNWYTVCKRLWPLAYPGEAYQHAFFNWHAVFNQLKLYFNALIFFAKFAYFMKGLGEIFNLFKGFYNYFSKFLHVRSQEIKLNMPKNYGNYCFLLWRPTIFDTHGMTGGPLNLRKMSSIMTFTAVLTLRQFRLYPRYPINV